MNPEQQSQLWTLFIQHLGPVVFTGLAGLLGWVLTNLAKYLQARAEGSKFMLVGAKLTTIAESVVADLNATLAEPLKEAAKDGVLTKAERLDLRDKALNRLKQQAGERGLVEAKALLGVAAPQLDAHLNGLIELAVAKLGALKAPENP